MHSISYYYYYVVTEPGLVRAAQLVGSSVFQLQS